jgi:hypothetical protein
MRMEMMMITMGDERERQNVLRKARAVVLELEHTIEYVWGFASLSEI